MLGPQSKHHLYIHEERNEEREIHTDKRSEKERARGTARKKEASTGGGIVCMYKRKRGRKST